MKRFLILSLVLIVGNVELRAQSSNIIFNGGWATVNPEDDDEAVNGFKVGFQYEFEVAEHWLVGGSLSYLSFKADDAGISGTTNITYTTLPFTAYGKYRIGNRDKLHGYLKGAIGIQVSTFKREVQSSEIKDNDVGLALGPGAGVILPVGEKIFIQLDYEFLYMTNSFYQDGTVNQLSLGLGIRLQ